MPLVHKSGGFVVNLYEGEDLFAIARDCCQKFSHFLDNHEKSWQQKSQMVNRSPTITSTFPEELNVLMTMMMIGLGKIPTFYEHPKWVAPLLMIILLTMMMMMSAWISSAIYPPGDLYPNTAI